MFNIDLHNKKEKGLVSVLTPQGGIMWVHTDLIETQQWTTVTNKKSKENARASYSNVVSVPTRETEEGAASLINSGEEESAFAIDVRAPSISKIRSDEYYLK